MRINLGVQPSELVQLIYNRIFLDEWQLHEQVRSHLETEGPIDKHHATSEIVRTFERIVSEALNEMFPDWLDEAPEPDKIGGRY